MDSLRVGKAGQGSLKSRPCQTTKPKNKKPVAVKSGGSLSSKKPQKEKAKRKSSIASGAAKKLTPEDYIRVYNERTPEQIQAVRKPIDWVAKGDPDGDNRPTLPDGRRYSIGNPDGEKPVESWKSRMAREEFQADERNHQKSFWKLVLETERFNDEGIISVAEEEKLSDPPPFLYLGLITEQVKFLYGKKADWRVFLCLLARNDSEGRKELSCRLTKAAAEANTAEIAAFQTAVTLIRNRHKKGANSKLRESQFTAMMYAVDYWKKFGQYPTRAVIKKVLRDNKMYFPKDGKALKGANDRRLFSGPILSKIPIGKSWKVKIPYQAFTET